MPGDSSQGSTRLKSIVWKRQRAVTEPAESTILPEQLRHRLNELFGQIEQEFEKLYTENTVLQERVDTLTCKLDQNADKLDFTDAVETNQKPAKKGSQISQKIKSTYKTSTSKLANTFKTSTSGCGHFIKEFVGHSDGVWEVSVSKCGQRVLGTASADYTAKIWCINSGAVVLQYYGHRGSVNSIRFSPTSDLVVTASGDRTAHIWRAVVSSSNHFSDSTKSSSEEDMGSNDDPHACLNGDVGNSHFIHAPLTQLTGHSNVVIAADWLAPGDKVATASWDGSAMIYDTERGDCTETLSGHESELTDVSCHSSQELILTSSKDSSVRLWDLRDSSVHVNAFMGHSLPVSSAVFANGDKIISGSDDRTVKLWDMKNMSAPYNTIRSDSPVNRLSVSSAGVIAVPHDNRHIRLYNLNGSRLGRLPRNSRIGHNRMVCSTTWNDDSNAICNLFSSGFEKHVLAWQVNASRLDSKELKRQHTA